MRYSPPAKITTESRMSSADGGDPRPSPESGRTIMVVTKGRLFRDGIRSVLEAPGRTIVSHYESLSEVPDAVAPPGLFVILIGNAEDPGDTFSQIRRLRATADTSRWLLLTNRNDPAFISRATSCGVDWLLPEDSPAEVLRLLTDLILLGQTTLPTRLTPLVTEGSRQGVDPPFPPNPSPLPPAREAPVHSPAPRISHPAPYSRSGGDAKALDSPVERRQIELSEREKEILSCLVSGLSNKIIARKLNIAEATVKAHVKGLLRKMQVANRTQAAILALNLLAGAAATADKNSTE
jgi:two-component system nitrate/nitrite response regulator NarL